MFPWWYYPPIVAGIFFVIVLVRNSRKLRRELGEQPSRDEIRAKYPKAWILPIGKGRKN